MRLIKCAIYKNWWTVVKLATLKFNPINGDIHKPVIILPGAKIIATIEGAGDI